MHCSHVDQEVGLTQPASGKVALHARRLWAVRVQAVGTLSEEAGPFIWGCVASKAITGQISGKGPHSQIGSRS